MRHVLLVAVALVWGCGGALPLTSVDGGVDAGVDSTSPDSGADSGMPVPDGGDAGQDSGTCVNLQCDLPTCDAGANTTTISGTVYAPNGTLPLYNAIVYVPNSPLTPFTSGVTCDQCGTIASGDPIAVTLTDAEGHFTIPNAPAGTNIPVVMQIGKWRRQIQVATVSPCVDNPVGQQVSGVEQLTRLPTKQSEGDMPRVAITTGACDPIACLMPKLGIDPSEFAPGPTSSTVKPTTAVSFYSGNSAGAPSGSPPAEGFWNDVNQLKNFDLVMLSCECTEPPDANTTSYQAVRQYLDAGGRIFTTDFMYVWYKDSPDTNLNATPWSWPGGAPTGGSPVDVDTAFPKGKGLGDWLYYVSGISPFKSEVVTYPPSMDNVPIAAPYGYTFDNVWGIDTKYGLEWMHSGPSGNTTGTPQHPRVITMGMPSATVPASQCGKAVHLDLHMDQGNTVSSSYPTGCTAQMREPELVDTFFFFNILSCIQDDTQPLVIPHI